MTPLRVCDALLPAHDVNEKICCRNAQTLSGCEGRTAPLPDFRTSVKLLAGGVSGAVRIEGMQNDLDFMAGPERAPAIGRAGGRQGSGSVAVADVELELLERGRGPALLYLHGGGGIGIDLPFLELLGNERRVLAPSHPGFGRSSLPDWLDSIDDIAHLYLELMDRLGLGRTDIVGFSIGGWIAAELASKVPERIDRLVLIGPVGVKTGPPDKLEVPDIFAMPQEKLDHLRFHDPARNPVDMAKLPDEELRIAARNRETLALLTWEPYMHNPKLRHRLHRVDAPTLLLRGASDGIVSADYLARYAALLRQARTETIAEAGHLPQVEQPNATAARILQFLR